MPYTLGCPQCGAPVELGETEQIIECPYCRVKQIIISQDHIPCRLAPISDTPPEDIVYIPYWHFKGLGFALCGPQVTYRILDLSAQAVPIKGIPLSLGLRPQTHPLHFIRPDTRARFLPVTIPKQRLLHRVGSRLLGIGPQQRTAPLQSYVGDLVQLIYAPVRITRTKVFDAITGREMPGCNATILQKKGKKYSGKLPTFLAAQCPHCGWDLTGNKESLCQACTHCDRLWISIKGDLRAVTYHFADQGNHECQWLPFWQMDAGNTEAALEHRADLIRLANLPRIPTMQDSNAPLTFTIPAFKLNPSLFLRLSRQTTIFPFKISRNTSLDKHLSPCTLPLTEAWQAISPLLYDMAKDKTRMQRILTDSSFRLQHCRILFAPFVRKGMELIQPDMNVSIPANAVLFGRSL